MPALLLGPVLRYVDRTSATLWVEVDAPGTVTARCGDRQATAGTFAVGGHHYALVVLTDLPPGTVTPYSLELAGRQIWPPPGYPYPPSVVRTLGEPDRARVVFGSCRYAAPADAGAAGRYGSDALQGLSRRLARRSPGLPADWPDLLLMLGDQVYADEVSPAIRRRIARRRDPRGAPGYQVRDFEEYTWLYTESWSEPDLRWLMSTVPVAMVCDDHDVHDDWNSSYAWRQAMAATTWWRERVAAALASAWVYQHLGNLGPAELERDPVWARVRAEAAAGRDAEPLLREWARAVDAAVEQADAVVEQADGVVEQHLGVAEEEAPGARYRWSFWRDLGRTRLVVVDSRCGRVLTPDRRAMVSDAEAAWVRERLVGDLDHVLVATSLPWLLPPALHAVEAADERWAAGSRRWVARAAERLRRGADLEHWAAFAASFDWLSTLLTTVADGGLSGSGPPACVAVLSGDVHHSYICQADLASPAPVYQLTCSPVRHWMPRRLRWAVRAAWSRPAGWAARLLGRRAERREPEFTWRRLGAPVFGNALGQVAVEGRAARFTLTLAGRPDSPRLELELPRGRALEDVAVGQSLGNEGTGR